MCKGFGCPLDCRSEMGKWSAVELLRWAVFQRGNSGRGTRRGNLVLASWWKHPAWGFPQHCFLEIQPGAKGNGLEVPCLFYVPELQHRPGVCTPKLRSTEKMGQFGDFFLRYATLLFCAPQMGKKSWRVSWDDYKFCNMPPRFIYWLRLDARKGFDKEWWRSWYEGALRAQITLSVGNSPLELDRDRDIGSTKGKQTAHEDWSVPISNAPFCVWVKPLLLASVAQY